MAEVYYFGCNGRSGHYLCGNGRSSLSYYDAAKLRVPSAESLDGGAALLPYPEALGVGALTYLPANDLTVLAWWGSPWDSRGAVNTAVMVRGRHDEEAVWSAFQAAYPNIAVKLERPKVVNATVDGQNVDLTNG